jgi:hypothetical protein
MEPSRSTISRTLVLAGVVLLAGCLGAATPGDGTATSTDTPTPTPTATPTQTDGPSQTPISADEGCARWISFWGLGGPDADKRWTSDSVRIGYAVTGNASTLLVASTNGTVLGTKYVETEDLNYGFTADGAAIEFDEALNGSHVVELNAYNDTNGNEKYDPEVDQPCASDGDVVFSQQRIDFDRFEPGEENEKTSPTKDG